MPNPKLEIQRAMEKKLALAMASDSAKASPGDRASDGKVEAATRSHSGAASKAAAPGDGEGRCGRCRVKGSRGDPEGPEG